MRRVSIFGATGSVGQSTIDLIARAPQAYRLVALSGGRNIARLAHEARRLGAEVAITAHEDLLEELRAALRGSPVEAAAGAQAIIEAATRPVDWAMSAIVGVAGLTPSLKVLEQGATLALANKESLVSAGALMLRTAQAHQARLLPVDSEHSAIFQVLNGEDPRTIERLILTASGGAFRDWPLEQLRHATLEQAMAHPTWKMGQWLTIDSASMFNKAMELIEAQVLFECPAHSIEVLMHPQSLVHALVGFQDGALMAHLGSTDMRHAIGYALHWPQRLPLPVARLDLADIGQLTFSKPDPVRYPALGLARQVMEARGGAGAIFNAARETALEGFISGRIGFTHMAQVVEETLNALCTQWQLAQEDMTLDIVQRMDHLGRSQAREIMHRIQP
ncbi:MAG: 1-deoxy-D-xylulose-5-phosphate reductoisomerase [Rhodobacteraceae bacterium]|nr:1-deoxy-D-xylulose-5-phosphate reductoisomerase [Paracoccaceae bacterium]